MLIRFLGCLCFHKSHGLLAHLKRLLLRLLLGLRYPDHQDAMRRALCLAFACQAQQSCVPSLLQATEPQTPDVLDRPEPSALALLRGLQAPPRPCGLLNKLRGPTEYAIGAEKACTPERPQSGWQLWVWRNGVTVLSSATILAVQRQGQDSGAAPVRRRRPCRALRLQAAG